LVKAKGSGGFEAVFATFTVPKVTCSGSIGGGKTSTYSEVSYWVGLGGYKVSALEQAGIAATCASKTSAPHYGALCTDVQRDDGGVVGSDDVGVWKGPAGCVPAGPWCSWWRLGGQSAVTSVAAARALVSSTMALRVA
jgi:hypothetical protein